MTDVITIPLRMTRHRVVEYGAQLMRLADRLVELRDARESLRDTIAAGGWDAEALAFYLHEAERLKSRMQEIRRAMRCLHLAFDRSDVGLER